MTDTVGGRAAFQVLVLPYRQTGQGTEYALFRRADAAYWQGVAGGGEAGESPGQAARRETAEEAGLVGEREFIALDARATIPVVYVTGEFTPSEDRDSGTCWNKSAHPGRLAGRSRRVV